MKLLQVRDLQVHYSIPPGWLGRRTFVQAVRGVSFDINENETVGIVGETGCGKSSLARAIVRLVPAAAGRIRFQGQELLNLNPRDLRRMRRQIQFVFPDAAHSLNSLLTTEQLLAEALDVHRLATRPSDRQQRIQELLRMVRLDPRDAALHPHQLNSGQRQCVGIARAMAVQPKLLIMDEPLAGVDGPAIAHLLDLLKQLQQQQCVACLVFTRDLAMIEHISHRVLVLYRGRVVEVGPARQLIRFPRHPYTQALVSAVPDFPSGIRRRPIILSGQPPSATELPSGCPLHPRCPAAEARCRVELPPLRDIVSDQKVACHLAR